MASMPDGQTRCGCQSAPCAPLVVDPAEPVSVEMVPVGLGGKARVPVLILPGGVRVCVDAFSVGEDAAEWWYDLGNAAMSASLCYLDGSEPLQVQ